MSDIRPLFDIAVFRALRKAGFLLFGIGVYVVVRLAVEELPLAGQVVILALVYAPLGLLVYRLSKTPEETLAPVRRHGLGQPFMFVTGLWLAAIGWVSAFSFVLAERGIVDFQTRAGAAVTSTGQLADFYIWQSFAQIPGLSINDTLQWEVPLQYGGGAGFVLMAFKVLILIPLVPVLLAAWRVRRAPKPAPMPAADAATRAP
ncbi:MAG: hypothetical protein QOG15_1420 [Solirubrobacteraceae bacterium]|nr:hypothetical protein [Solirubrobacteraceae bacterium]